MSMINSVVKLEAEGKKKLMILKGHFHLKLHLRIQHQKSWMASDLVVSVLKTPFRKSLARGRV